MSDRRSRKQSHPKKCTDWQHDLYIPRKQRTKTDEEIIQKYGYNIREEISPEAVQFETLRQPKKEPRHEPRREPRYKPTRGGRTPAADSHQGQGQTHKLDHQRDQKQEQDNQDRKTLSLKGVQLSRLQEPPRNEKMRSVAKWLRECPEPDQCDDCVEDAAAGDNQRAQEVGCLPKTDKKRKSVGSSVVATLSKSFSKLPI